MTPIELIESCGAVERGHFILSSGRHSDTYLEKFRVLERPDVLAKLVSPIVRHYRRRRPDMVAGPSTGGLIVAYEVAKQLGVPVVYVEEENGRRAIRRGRTLEEGVRVLVVDDVLTTGGSLVAVRRAIEENGGEPMGIGVLIDRSESRPDLGLEVFATCRVEATTYGPGEVPAELASIEAETRGTNIL